MRQCFAIFINTFNETIRQPVYGLLLAITTVFILMVPLSSAHIMTLSVGTSMQLSAQRSVAELALSTILLSGLLFSVFCTTSVISREIEQKTALTVLSKRVSRFSFVIGKYLGVSCAISMAILTFIMLTLMMVRFGSNTAAYQPIDVVAIIITLGSVLLALLIATWRNYFSGKSWIGTFAISDFYITLIGFLVLMFLDKDFHFAFHDGKFGSYDWQPGLAGIMALEAILCICAVAVAASTRLKAAGNFCVCAIAFVGGLTSQYFFDNYGKYILVKIWHAIVPNMQTFWMAEALKKETDIPLSYASASSLYAIAYIVAILFVAAYLFERREIT